MPVPTAQCPACYTELPPGATQCPVCLRPVSRHEMMQALNAQRRAQERERKRPYYVAAAVVVLAAAGAGLRTLQRMGFTLHPAPPPHASAPEPQSAVPAPAPQPAQQPPPQPAQQPPPTSPEPPARPPAPAFTPQQPQPHETATPAAENDASPETPAPDQPAAENWTIHGTVYDLLSLRPAASAKLRFEDRSSGQIFRATTDAKGRYTVSVPRLTEGGYWVSVSAKGYRGDYLEEGSPPFMSRSRARREDAAMDAAQTQVLHVPIFLDKDSDVEYNVALLPRQ